MALWLGWQRREFAHWFPLAAAPGERKTPDLAPPGHWQTLVWFAVYWFLWAQIFGQGQLAGF